MDGALVRFVAFIVLAVVAVLAIRGYTQRAKRDAGEPPPQTWTDTPASWEEYAASYGDDAAANATPPSSPTARPSAYVPPAPPPDLVEAHRAALEAVRHQAVLLRREVPPRHGAPDHWGGVPSVPRDFTWPFFVTDDGRDRPLHLVLQLDCASIPERGRLGLMPDDGMLYVFLDLDWGEHWRWSVRYVPAGSGDLVPATPPAGLPHAYGSPSQWGWPRTEADWPRLLPWWSIDPVLVTGDGTPAEDDDPRFWPGTIPLADRLAAIDGGVQPAHWFSNTYDADGALVRPWATYPHDWRAVTILAGHLARQAERDHLRHHVARGVMTEEEASAQLADLRTALATWSARAAAQHPWSPLPQEDRDAVWQLVLDHQPVALFGLTEAVNDSVEATLSGSPDATQVLPTEAIDLVRSRHALATRDRDGGVHVADTARMLCAPSYVQGDAEERLGEWLLLLEISGTASIGHHFGEGVYQFWIRPADLAARRFDLVELTASAY